MFDEFKQRFKTIYFNNTYWNKIFVVIFFVVVNNNSKIENIVLLTANNENIEINKN